MRPVVNHHLVELPEKTSALVWPVTVLSAAPVVAGLGGLAFASTLGTTAFAVGPLAAGGATGLLVSPQRSMRAWALCLALFAAVLALVFMLLMVAVFVLVLPRVPGD
jgi:hypothetical protein